MVNYIHYPWNLPQSYLVIPFLHHLVSIPEISESSKGENGPFRAHCGYVVKLKVCLLIRNAEIKRWEDLHCACATATATIQ